MEYKDYYKTLGVSKGADKKTIKKAFRKLARQYHPDKNQGDKAAEEKFKDINEAYEVLSDAEKRKMYDRFGSQWQQYQRAGGNPNDFWGQWAGQGGRSYGRTINPEDLGQMFGGGSGFSDFFEMLFGQMGGQGGFGQTGFGGQQGGRRQMPAQEHTVEVTLEEAFQGSTRTLTWEDGRTLNAKIPRGVKTGSKIRLKGQGGGGGDLYLKVKVLPHNRFERDGDDLKVTVPVDLYTAVLGGKVDVTGIGKTVKLTIPEGTANGKTFRLRGLGMPKLRKPAERGDLLAMLDIQIPKNLSQQEKGLFAELKRLREI
ncbi:MAG: DnaJ C-terminal domain-containing protein [Anaerolineae bacterium]